MTTGELVFYSGVGLLIFTLLLAVVFLIKRPKYVPEQLGHLPDGTGSTQKLRSGYPTDPLTHRRETGGKAAVSVSAPQAAPAPKPAAVSAAPGTVPLEQSAAAPQPGTVPLEQGTALLEDGTVPLEPGTVPLREGTVPLQEDGGTELLSGGTSHRK